jgi:hypothetical protein
MKYFLISLFLAIVAVAQPYPKLQYMGGPVMNHGLTVYVIWYGDWTSSGASAAIPVIENFYRGFGTTPRSLMTQRLADSTGLHVSAPTFGASVYDAAASQGTTLTYSGSTSSIQTIINYHIVNGDLTVNENAIYAVMMGQNVVFAANCNCQAIHDNYVRSGKNLKWTASLFASYATINSNFTTFNGIAKASGTYLNSEPISMQIISGAMHELEEAATDPQSLTAGWGGGLNEIDDHCSFNFAGTYIGSDSNGVSYNVRIGSYLYLLQPQQLNTGPTSNCYMSLPSPMNWVPAGPSSRTRGVVKVRGQGGIR